MCKYREQTQERAQRHPRLSTKRVMWGIGPYGHDKMGTYLEGARGMVTQNTYMSLRCRVNVLEIPSLTIMPFRRVVAALFTLKIT